MFAGGFAKGRKNMPRSSIILVILLLGMFARPSRAHENFIVAIDIGHSPDSGGAFSARNRPEYAYNLKMASALARELKKEPRVRVIVINQAGDDLSFQQRTDLINRAEPDFLISIHHDSVQPAHLSEWT